MISILLAGCFLRPTESLTVTSFRSSHLENNFFGALLGKLAKLINFADFDHWQIETHTQIVNFCRCWYWHLVVFLQISNWFCKIFCLEFPLISFPSWENLSILITKWKWRKTRLLPVKFHFCIRAGLIKQKMILSANSTYLYLFFSND